MSTSNELTDVESRKVCMKPAVRKIFCCSVNAAAGFIAAYALVSYSIALIYQIVWVVEAQSGLPLPSLLLMICYGVVIVATVGLVHGLITKNNKYLFSWLVAVTLVLIPECALVFYMSISHWGLQGVYGGAELTCYVARLPAIVVGVVLVQSAYAIREMRLTNLANGLPGSGSEFDASHFVPATHEGFTNDGFLTDNGKSGSMPDLRRHLASRQSINYGYPMIPPPPPAYWQHLAERQYAASLRGYPKSYPNPQMYGTWMGSRGGSRHNSYKRRHSVVGAFNTEEYPVKEYDIYGDDRTDCKSEMGHLYCRPYIYDPRMYPTYDPRFYPDFKREDYGVNLLRHEPYYFGSRERVFYNPGLRHSHTSVGNESDDLTKYKDVAL